MLKMGKFDKAEAIFHSLFDDIHQATSTGNNIPKGFSLYVTANYALILRILGKIQESVRLYKVVIEGRKMIFGPEHSATVGAQEELSHVFQGKLRARSMSIGRISLQSSRFCTHSSARRVRSIEDLVTLTRNDSRDPESHNVNLTVAHSGNSDPTWRVNSNASSLATGLPDPLRVDSHNTYIRSPAESDIPATKQKDWVEMPPNAKVTDPLDWEDLSSRRYLQYSNVDPLDYLLTGDIDYYWNIQAENGVPFKSTSSASNEDDFDGKFGAQGSLAEKETLDQSSMEIANESNHVEKSRCFSSFLKIATRFDPAEKDRADFLNAADHDCSPLAESDMDAGIASSNTPIQDMMNDSRSQAFTDMDFVVQKRTGYHARNKGLSLRLRKTIGSPACNKGLPLRLRKNIGSSAPPSTRPNTGATSTSLPDGTAVKQKRPDPSETNNDALPHRSDFNPWSQISTRTGSHQHNGHNVNYFVPSSPILVDFTTISSGELSDPIMGSRIDYMLTSSPQRLSF